MDWFTIEERGGQFVVIYHHEDGTRVESQKFSTRDAAVQYCSRNQTDLGLKED